MRLLILSICLVGSSAVWAHVPALLLPIKGTPIASYFIGQSDISHAIYSELTEPQDYFVVQFEVKNYRKQLIQILTPVCKDIPAYEEYQPSVLVLRGDLPWKMNGETNTQFIARLKARALGKAESNFKKGERPQFYEEFGKQSYWVGGELHIRLNPGLYALVVFDRKNGTGTFSLGLNEKEAWTPDLYKYVGEILPKINAGLCDPKGFSGSIKP